VTTTVDPQRLAPGHTILRDPRWPQLWTCTCRATGRGPVPNDRPSHIVDLLHLEAKWSRAADL
jgi:hypothetical protein